MPTEAAELRRVLGDNPYAVINVEAVSNSYPGDAIALDRERGHLRPAARYDTVNRVEFGEAAVDLGFSWAVGVQTFDYLVRHLWRAQPAAIKTEPCDRALKKACRARMSPGRWIREGPEGRMHYLVNREVLLELPVGTLTTTRGDNMLQRVIGQLKRNNEA